MKSQITMNIPNRLIDDLEHAGRFTRVGDEVIISAFGERAQSFQVIEETADYIRVKPLPTVTS